MASGSHSPEVYLDPDTLLPMEHDQSAPLPWYDVAQYLWPQGSEDQNKTGDLLQRGGSMRIQSGEIAL